MRFKPSRRSGPPAAPPPASYSWPDRRAPRPARGL